MAIASLATCGITTLPFLEPPVAVVHSTNSQTFEFDGPDPDNIDPVLFEGYEFYYKFYYKGGLGPTDLTSLSALINNGFARLHQRDDVAGDVAKPLVAVPLLNRTSPQSATVTIDFGRTPAEPWVATSWAPLPGDEVELRRATLDDLGRFELLSDTDSFDPVDLDVQELIDPSLTWVTTDVALLLYALSFGRDFATEIYSTAEYLGEIIISFP